MSTSDSPLVICLGSVVADHTFKVDEIPQAPAKARARGYELKIGGMAANAAIAVRRLGGRAAYWGRLGDDGNADILIDGLTTEGIELGGMKRIPGGRSAVAAVLVDPLGERVTLGYRGEGLDPDPSWLPLDTLDKAGALLCDPRWPEGAQAALEAAEQRGIPTVLDGERSETRLLLDLVPRVRYAIFSVTGLTNYGSGARAPEALRKAVSEGVTQMAAVTRGEKSTLWILRGEERIRETPIFRVTASDTTGAGDVFHGAFALAMAEGMEMEAAIRFSSAAGALRARDGATAHRAELEAFLQENAAIAE
ncbi:PfkB family carbohydrate kinase [Roseococcus sp.]|uniref:PfkB family carbohydrate kinase n=1 Tax=Roseococcus sp. TaxID=2109646 RepID=UPI003BA902FC